MNIHKRTKTIVLITFVFVIVCATLILWFQQFQPTEVNAQSQPQLTLEISTPENKYVQLEPISLDFKLSNQITVPLTWNGMPMLGSRDINILSRASNGNEFRWLGRRSVVDAVMDTEIMQPNKNKEIHNLIDGYILEQIFPQPGRYELRVEFNYTDLTYGQRQNVTIVSKPIMIEIIEPRGKDRLAYEYLKNIYKQVNNISNVSEMITAQRYFANNFSDTVYGKYMTYKLANSYMSAKEFEKAEDEFYKISDVDFYYSKQVDDQLRELANKLHRPNRRTKRKPDLSNIPVARPLPSQPPPPIYTASPLPGNAPVLIRIPNPNPNSTP